MGGNTEARSAGVERAIDTVLLAVAAADVRADSTVGVEDIGEAVISVYSEWAAGHIAAGLDRGPCGDDCPLMPGVEYISAILGQAIAEHVIVEIALLMELRDATGQPADQALRQVRERFDAAGR